MMLAPPPDTSHILEQIPDAFLALDSEARFTYVNQRAAELFGAIPQDLIGRHIGEVFPQGVGHAFRQACGRVLMEQVPITVEQYYEPRSGWYESRIHPAPAGLFVFTREITARRRDEERLRESEERFRLMVEASEQVFFYRHDLTGRFEYLSPSVHSVLGYRPEELVGKQYQVLLADPQSLDATRCATREAYRSKRVQAPYTVINRHRDGHSITVEVSESPVRRDGEIVGMQGFARDVTERVQVERLLRQGKERYEQMVALSPDAVLVHSGGIIRFANLAALRLLGASSAEDLVGCSMLDITHPEHRPLAESRIRWMEQHLTPAPIVQYDLVRLDGRRVTGEFAAAPVVFDGELLIQVFIRDLTERQRTEAALRESEERFRQLAENSRHAFWMVDLASRQVIYLSPAYARIWGEVPERLLQRPGHWLERIHHEDRERVGAALQAVRLGARSEAEYRILRDAPEAVRWVRTRAFPIRNDQGEVYRIAGLVEDVTEARTREEHLRRAERLATVGTLVGGVAHELNNPLTAIKSFAQLLLCDAQEEEDREALEIICREADRSARIVSDLRLLARKTQDGQQEHTAVDLNDVVQHVLKLRRYNLSTQNITLEEDLAGGLPPVRADRSEIEQVVINLVVNAEQALVDHHSVRSLRVRTARSGAERITLEVSDTGPGIRPEHVGHIFDPFFTTKLPGDGTGLGLSLVHGIITEHEGAIRVESEWGRGTRFIVELPAAPPGREPLRAGPLGPGNDRQPLRVLVVDDEAAVRHALIRLLRRRGHQADEAVNGQDALTSLQGSDYDVVLTDLRMPGLGGEDLLAALQETASTLCDRIVMMTGDAANQQGIARVTTQGVPVLLKPFDLEEALQLVEQRAANERPR